MQARVVWFPLALSSSRRQRRGLVAYLTPDGGHVIYLDEHSEATALPSLTSRHRPHLARYLMDAGLAPYQLRALFGEVRVDGVLSSLLMRDILNVLLLSEDPPGNPPVPNDLPLPLESISVQNEGSEWPGYETASLEPDGDVLVNHVILSSVIPPAV